MILGEEDVHALGELPRFGTAHHLVPAIERMARPLGGFLGDQLAARRHGTILGGILQGIGTNRRRSSGTGSTRHKLVRRLARLDAADEALQPLLLSVVEFLRHAPPHSNGEVAAS